MYGDLIGGLGGLVGAAAVLGGAAGKGGEPTLKKAVNRWDQLPLPELDQSQLSWEELQVLAQENPTLYSAIVPTAVQTGQDSAALQGRQAEALAQMQQIAQEGMPVADRLAAQEAQSRVSGSARMAQQAVLRDLAERGRLGAGDEIQARLGASQQASTLGRGMAADLATQSQNARMAGIQSYGQMAGEQRQQGFENSNTTANVVNNFNNLVANMRNQAAASNAAAQTQAQAANAQTKQRLGETNAVGRMDTNATNLANRNALRQQGFDNSVTKTQGVTGAMSNLATGQYAGQAGKENAILAMGGGGGKAAGGALDFWKAKDEE